ncbi:hypothetical protein [Aquihabitans sp. McL0605]|uniref:hypothetical protein n=1 Tax=Aquihabitans sp. McL0605 TaxID=3415671 RepID=UPI003CE69C6C
MDEILCNEVVATSKDRTFLVPNGPIQFAFRYAPDDSPLVDVLVGVEVVDRRPRFTSVKLDMHRPMSPVEVQRLPWGRIAEGALEDAARTADGARSPREVHEARQKERRGRQRVSEDRLREILRLKAEAQAQGVAWDEYAAERLDLKRAYVRQLGSRAERELGGL